MHVCMVTDKYPRSYGLVWFAKKRGFSLMFMEACQTVWWMVKTYGLIDHLIETLGCICWAKYASSFTYFLKNHDYSWFGWKRHIQRDRRTDGTADGRTDRRSYRDATTHLKTLRTGTRPHIHRYMRLCGCTRISRYTHTRIQSRTQNILLTEGAKKRA